jgi:asparagine synthase (glutamine-hydrolysing)
MCGICGIFAPRGHNVPSGVARMMHAMVHRGPDDQGYEEISLGSGDGDPTIGLGFRRLAIIDLTPTGHQPMLNPDTGDCIVFNGEIYNFQSLRTELQCDGVRFRGTSDTEVLLHALSRWGESALTRIAGMYAFAFYEAKTQRVLLARDPLGIKPLYIAEVADGVVFASEVRAVLASGIVPDDLDQAGVATMLAYGSPQDPFTLHRAIKSFPAGGCGWIRMGADGTVARVESRPFWRFPSQATSSPSMQVATTHVRTLLENAVAQHLVSDRPAGIFLSAGIDSFAVAALGKAARGDVVTFTVGFDESGIADEVREAADAAKVLGTIHRPVILNSREVEPLWNSWLATADRPSIDGFNTFVVSHAVKHAGKAVALSGLGGDELFGGYPNFASVKRYSALLAALRPVPASIRLLGLRWLLRSRSQTFRERAEELVGGNAGLERIALRLRRILTDRQVGSLGVDLASLPLDDHFLDPSVVAAICDNATADAFNTIARLECGLYMGNTLLRDTDVVSMAHSLEVRVPLLDQHVVNYVMQLPERLKTRPGGPTKYLLREALRGLLPDTLLSRPKTGFCLPIDRWMHGPLRDSCQAAIDYLAGNGPLDSGEVRSLWNDFLASSANVHWVRPMALVALGSYLQNRSDA